MVQGQVFLKAGGMALLFNFFKIYHCQHNFKKKGHSKLSKNESENIP